MCLCTSVCSSEDTLKDSVPSFQCLGSEDETQVVKTRHAYLLSHLAGSTVRILEHLNNPIENTFAGEEGWFSGWEYLLLFPKAQVWSITTTWPLTVLGDRTVTPVLADLSLSLASMSIEFHAYDVQTYMQTNRTSKSQKSHISKYASPSKFLGLHKHSIMTLQLPLIYAIKMMTYIRTEMCTQMYTAMIFLAIKHGMWHFICTCFYLGSEEAHPSSPLSSSETCLSKKTASQSPASSPVLSYFNGLDLLEISVFILRLLLSRQRKSLYLALWETDSRNQLGDTFISQSASW